MDWNAAIEKNREALKRVLAMLVAMAGLQAPAPALPRHLHRTVLGLLRPAEAAARRLIIVMARGLVLALPRPRKPKPKRMTRRTAGRADMPLPLENLARRVPPLPLLDPLRPRNGGCARPVAARSVPRISMLDFNAPFRRLPPPPSPDDPVNAARLALRLEALASALDDLPGQARRFARWRARRDAAVAQRKEGRDAGRIRRLWPLRPGRPPGTRF